MAGDEEVTDGLLDLGFAPGGVLLAQGGGLDFPSGVVERLGDLKTAARGHPADEVGLNGFGRGRLGGHDEERNFEVDFSKCVNRSVGCCVPLGRATVAVGFSPRVRRKRMPVA